MTKIIFTFDEEANHWNVWDSINNDPNFTTNNDNLIKICKSKKSEESKKELENYYKIIYNSKLFKIFPKIIQETWSNIEGEFFKRLNNLIKPKEEIEKITAKLTTIKRAPYNPKDFSFFFSLHNSIPQLMKSCAHEVLHIYFHNSKYWDMCIKEIGIKETHNLKESLTILLNIEFKDLWGIEDKGYPMHKNLRSFIKKEWTKEKDFEILIKKCIKEMK